MIYRCSDHTRWETRDILSMLQIDRGSAPVISIAGGGGKTTTAFCLKRGFAERKEPVLLTTTTHMRRPTGPEVLLEDSETEFQTKLKKYGWVIAGLPAENGKISSMPVAFLEKRILEKIPLVIEADGARCLPVKMPEAWEPVLHLQTDLFVGMIGLDALGQPLGEICFRRNLAAEFLEKDLDEKMTWEDLARIAAAPEGLMKGTEHIRRRLVFLNKAEGKERIEAGKKIASYLQERKIGEVYLSSYGEEERA